MRLKAFIFRIKTKDNQIKESTYLCILLNMTLWLLVTHSASLAASPVCVTWEVWFYDNNDGSFPSRATTFCPFCLPSITYNA